MYISCGSRGSTTQPIGSAYPLPALASVPARGSAAVAAGHHVRRAGGVHRQRVEAPPTFGQLTRLDPTDRKTVTANAASPPDEEHVQSPARLLSRDAVLLLGAARLPTGLLCLFRRRVCTRLVSCRGLTVLRGRLYLSPFAGDGPPVAVRGRFVL